MNQSISPRNLATTRKPALREIAEFLRFVRGMNCNCDLDNWEPELSTGHSQVCRIHKAAMTASAELCAEIAQSTGANK